MELAYKGEISTPSKCGRMDQCCAFGQATVLMTFDGEIISSRTVSTPHHLRRLKESRLV